MRLIATLLTLLPLLALAQQHVELPAPDVQSFWNRAHWHEEHTGKTYIGEILEADWDFFAEAEHSVEKRAKRRAFPHADAEVAHSDTAG